MLILDVTTMQKNGPLDNIAGFVFENYLGRLKKLIRKLHAPATSTNLCYKAVQTLHHSESPQSICYRRKIFLDWYHHSLLVVNSSESNISMLYGHSFMQGQMRFDREQCYTSAEFL